MCRGDFDTLCQRLCADNSGNNRLVAQIIVDGEVTEEIDLDKIEKAYTLSPKDGTVIAKVSDEGVRAQIISAIENAGYKVL